MLQNSKGFSLVESLAAASILMMIITTLVPLAALLLNERENLQQKQAIRHELHHELQPYVWEKDHELPHTMSKTIKGTEAFFQFTNEDGLLKGCVTWENANKREDSFCLFGHPEK